VNVKELMPKAVELAKYLDKFVKLPSRESCGTEITLVSILFNILFIYDKINYKIPRGDKK
jgi:hypothetical protein